jgi:hypothetical protein
MGLLPCFNYDLVKVIQRHRLQGRQALSLEAIVRNHPQRLTQEASAAHWISCAAPCISHIVTSTTNIGSQFCSSMQQLDACHTMRGATWAGQAHLFSPPSQPTSALRQCRGVVALGICFALVGLQPAPELRFLLCYWQSASALHEHGGFSQVFPPPLMNGTGKKGIGRQGRGIEALEIMLSCEPAGWTDSLCGLGICPHRRR